MNANRSRTPRAGPLGPGSQSDTAPLRRRIEAGTYIGMSEFFDEGGDQVQVHVTHQDGVLRGQPVERAVREHYGLVQDARFIPADAHHRQGAVTRRTPTTSEREDDPHE